MGLRTETYNDIFKKPENPVNLIEKGDLSVSYQQVQKSK